MPGGAFTIQAHTRSQRQDRDLNPGHQFWRYGFRHRSLRPLAHLANTTTIALAPTTRKHGGGDDASRTVNRPRELGHL